MSRLPPVDVKDPEIAREMLIDEIIVPDKASFKGRITEDNLKELLSQDWAPMNYFQKTIIAMSILEQRGDWQDTQLVEINTHLRRLEAEMIRRKQILESLRQEQKEQKWTLTFGKWAAVTIGAGAISAVFRWLLGH